MERVALQAVLVMPGLLLQKPHAKAGAKEFGKAPFQAPCDVEGGQNHGAVG